MLQLPSSSPDQLYLLGAVKLRRVIFAGFPAAIRMSQQLVYFRHVLMLIGLSFF